MIVAILAYTHMPIYANLLNSGCQDSIRFGIFQAEEWKKSRINWEWGDFNLLPIFWKNF